MKVILYPEDEFEKRALVECSSSIERGLVSNKLRVDTTLLVSNRIKLIDDKGALLYYASTKTELEKEK